MSPTVRSRRVTLRGGHGRRRRSRSPTDIRAGVVSLPHGWGHNLPGTRLSVANEHAGVNTNVLAPGTFVDVISGNAAVNGIPVTIGPANP